MLPGDRDRRQATSTPSGSSGWIPLPLHAIVAEWIAAREVLGDAGSLVDLGAAGVHWRQNALRHNHASYPYALDRNLEKLTAAMGNSVRIDRQYYQNPQPPRVAKQWFAIYPPDGGTIVKADFG